MRIGSLFSGIGGLELGLEHATGGRVLWQCERDPWCRKVLARHWPDAQRFDDVCTVATAAHPLAPVDLVCGGFPCQPVSLAGARKGTDDVRWLWPEFKRVLRVVGPRFVLLENVRGLLTANGGLALAEVLGGLAELGYAAEWDLFRASDVGAPHRRERWFCLAYRVSDGWHHDEALGDAGGVAASARRCHCERCEQAVSADGSSALAYTERLGQSSERSAELASLRARPSDRPSDGHRPLAYRHGDGEPQPRGPLGEERGWACDTAVASPLGDATGARRDGSARSRREGSRRLSEIAASGGVGLADTERIAPQRRGGPGIVARAGRDAQGEALERQRGGDAAGGRGEAVRGVALGNPCGEGLPRHGDLSVGAQEALPGQRGAGGRLAQPRVGGDLDGFSRGLDGHRWPAGRGEAQAPWEPPRVTEGCPDRRARLKALGNAVVPQVAALAWRALSERAGIVSPMEAA